MFLISFYVLFFHFWPKLCVEMRLLIIMLALAVPDAGGVDGTLREVSGMEGILLITGASAEEDLDETVVERFESLHRHPLAINCCTRSRLISSGLFSRYQIASLLDYRERYGDVLSFTELAAVDGFGVKYAEALKDFVTLDGGEMDGGRSLKGRRKFSQSLMLRAAARAPDGEAEWCGGAKYQAKWGEFLEFNWADRTTYTLQELGLGTMNLSVYGRRMLGKLIVGDFNARFGQGLLVWNGFSMSGVSSPSALSRNGTGLSPSRSFSESLHGVAADFNLGRYMVSAAYDRGNLALANLSRLGRIWQLGVTAVYDGSKEPLSGMGRFGLSLDTRIGFKGGSVFGEAALDGNALAAVLGMLYVPSYGSMFSVLVRAYPKTYPGAMSGAGRSASKVSDEYGASAAWQNGWSLLTLDAAWHPSKNTQTYKGIAQLKKTFQLGRLALTPVLRVTERCSLKPSSEGRMVPDWRSDMRVELDTEIGPWLANVRYNAVHSAGWGSLVYAEAGYRKEGPRHSLTVWLRGELFETDGWEDRIYVYERDAPGNFNVPAYYGKGWNASLVVSWKFWRNTLNLRVSAYKREVKLQYSLNL